MLVTPSWRGDIGNVARLRQSMRSRGTRLPHVIVAHTEDADMFRERFRDDAAVEIVPTSQVLSPSIEWRRRRSQARRRWLPVDWLPSQGWFVQQVTKLAVANTSLAVHYVVIDSDYLVTATLTEADFLDPSGIPFHFHTTGVNVMSLAAYANAAQCLAVPPHRRVELRNHSHGLQVFTSASVRKAQARLSSSDDRRRAWDTIFLDRQLNEFEFYAAFLDAQAQSHATTRCLDDDFLTIQPVPWTAGAEPADVVRLATSSGHIRFVCISSNIRGHAWDAARDKIAIGL